MEGEGSASESEDTESKDCNDRDGRPLSITHVSLNAVFRFSTVLRHENTRYDPAAVEEDFLALRNRVNEKAWRRHMRAHMKCTLKQHPVVFVCSSLSKPLVHFASNKQKVVRQYVPSHFRHQKHVVCDHELVKTQQVVNYSDSEAAHAREHLGMLCAKLEQILLHTTIYCCDYGHQVEGRRIICPAQVTKEAADHVEFHFTVRNDAGMQVLVAINVNTMAQLRRMVQSLDACGDDRRLFVMLNAGEIDKANTDALYSTLCSEELCCSQCRHRVAYERTKYEVAVESTIRETAARCVGEERCNVEPEWNESRVCAHDNAANHEESKAKEASDLGDRGGQTSTSGANEENTKPGGLEPASLDANAALGDGTVLDVDDLPPAAAAPPAPLFDDKQLRVLQLVDDGENVFMTGGGGTGKSFVIAEVVRRAQQRGVRVDVTASTGAAAEQIQGVTLHSVVGLGIAAAPVELLISQVMTKESTVDRIRKLQLLIVDEVSMLAPDYFDKVDAVFRRVRENIDAPFGGVQMLLVGDFYQLPPVVPVRGQKRNVRGTAVHAPEFAFETQAWKHAIKPQNIIELTKIFRQASDTSFVEVLQRVRKGQHTAADVALLKTRMCSSHVDSAAQCNDMLQLMTTNDDLDVFNADKLRGVDGAVITFTAIKDGAGWTERNPNFVSEVEKRVPSVLNLKCGAKVMLLKNVDPAKKLVNGAQGTVVGFVPSRKEANAGRQAPVVRFKNGMQAPIDYESYVLSDRNDEPYYYRQVPLKLAWAVTIHKSQGMTLDEAAISLPRTFAAGQAYVALSRVRSLTGIHLKEFDEACIRAHPKVLKFEVDMQRKRENAELLDLFREAHG